MSHSPIITPDQLRSAPLIGGPSGAGFAGRRAPTLDELIENFLQGLNAACEKDLSRLPALEIYAELGEQLRALGLSKTVIAKILPKIKIAAPEAFVNHAKFKEFVRLFATMIYNLHTAVYKRFGEDGEELFLNMVTDRFALVIPIE